MVVAPSLPKVSQRTRKSCKVIRPGLNIAWFKVLRIFVKLAMARPRMQAKVTYRPQQLLQPSHLTAMWSWTLKQPATMKSRWNLGKLSNFRWFWWIPRLWSRLMNSGPPFGTSYPEFLSNTHWNPARASWWWMVIWICFLGEGRGGAGSDSHPLSFSAQKNYQRFERSTRWKAERGCFRPSALIGRQQPRSVFHLRDRFRFLS